MEIWKQHPDFRDYEFSNCGNFRRLKTGKILKQTLNEDGYCISFLFSYSKQKRIRVRIHRAVAEIFIPKPEDPLKNHINHRDGIKTNNHYTNLEWITNQENIQHSIETGLRKRSPFQKLTEDDVRIIRNEYNETDISTVELAKRYDVSIIAIKSLLNYKTYPNVDPEKKYHYKINQTNNKDFIKSKYVSFLNKKNSEKTIF